MEQRRLGVGISRMAHMSERTELEGIVSPPDGAKPREVLREVGEAVRRRGRGFALLALLALPAAPPASGLAATGSGPADLDRVVDRLERTYAAAADLTAHFRQTSSITAAGQVQQASGLVEVKRPGRMRWEYTEPEPRLFVTDGRTFWAYSPEDKQVLVQETKGALGATPLAFLMGAGKLRKDFHVREVAHAATGKKTALLDLRPVKPNAAMARLLLEVDLASSLIVQATVFDAVGNTIVLALSDQKLNVGLPDSRFTFVPPPGVQVLTAPSGHR